MHLSFDTWILVVGFLMCLVPATGWKPGQDEPHGKSSGESDKLVERARVDMERRRGEA